MRLPNSRLPGRSRVLRLGAIVAAVAFAADRFSKWWLIDVTGMTIHREIEFGPFFSLIMVWNRGVSFGMFDHAGDNGRWLFAGLAAVIVIVLVVWLHRASDRLIAVALGLVIGGAIGNIYDRLAYGAVADFFDFHIGGHHWPAFNIADSVISIGVVLLLWDALYRQRGRQNGEGSNGEK